MELADKASLINSPLTMPSFRLLDFEVVTVLFFYLGPAVLHIALLRNAAAFPESGERLNVPSEHSKLPTSLPNPREGNRAGIIPALKKG